MFSLVPENLKKYHVAEEALPQRLINEFAKLSDGILPNVAMASIAAIRNATHHILAKFHSGMDGPFLTHRALLTIPQEAVTYAENLIASEFQSILSVKKTGERFADLPSIKKRLEILAGNKKKIS